MSATSHRRSLCGSNFLRLILPALILISGAKPVLADAIGYWNGNVNSDWSYTDTTPANNWYDQYGRPAPYSPIPNSYGDHAYFNQSSANMNVTFSAPIQLDSLAFTGNGAGYTIGTTGDTANGLSFNNYNSTIVLQSSLAGDNGSETIAEPITAYSDLYIGSYSLSNNLAIDPTAYHALQGFSTAGIGNTLYLTGPLTTSNNLKLQFLGTGDTVVSGNITQSSGNLNLVLDTLGSVTFAGSNTLGTNSATQIGGTLILDYTTNNTDKLAPTANVFLGNKGHGGTIIVNGSNTASTVQTISTNGFTGSGTPPVYSYNAATYIQAGASQVVINAGTNQNATLNLGAIQPQSNSFTLDFEANNNGTGVATITANNYNGNVNGNNVDIGGNKINILGQQYTYGESYWAQAGTVVGQSGYSSTAIAINPLLTDDGTAFNATWGNFHVDASGLTLAAASTPGANTVRFGDTGGGTLDLNGNHLTMVYGGILVAKDVTGDTAISNGSLASDGTFGGLTVFNYGTGTLTISADINSVNAEGLTKSGAGKVILSGNNWADKVSVNQHQTISVLSGELVLGSATALGPGANLQMGDATSILDLNGHSFTVRSLNSDPTLGQPGSQAAALGLNTNIENTVAGTIARLTISGDTQTAPINRPSQPVYGFPGLGEYYGGFQEASGAILSLQIDQGTATDQVMFYLANSAPGGDFTGFNSVTMSGYNGYSDIITGSIGIGSNTILGIGTYGNIQTLGVLTLNGQLGGAMGQGDTLTTTYLAGNGSFTFSNGGFYLDIDHLGSAADTFTGVMGTSTQTAGVALVTSGVGQVALTNDVYNYGIQTFGESKLVLPALRNNVQLSIQGQSTVTVTGTSGIVTGGNALSIQNGTLVIAPSGSGADVVVSGGLNADNLQYGGSATIILDKGANNSVTYQYGNGGTFTFNQSNERGALYIGATDGLAGLGTTDKFVVLGSSFQNNWSSQMIQNGIVSPDVVGVDYSPGSSQSATFLQYSGTGTASDAGFVAMNFGTNTNNLAASTLTSTELVTAGHTETLAADASVYALQVDNGGVVNTNGHNLNIGDSTGGVNQGGLILNGGSITGVTNLVRYTNIYTDLHNGSIEVLNVEGQDFAKNGAGTLTIGTISSANNDQITINDGALDVGNLTSFFGSNAATVLLHGGVLQGSGTINLALGTGGVDFRPNQDYGGSYAGGFSARGANLTVTLGSGVQLVWGTTTNFLNEGGVLLFGSTTANRKVTLTNKIDLGQMAGSFTSGGGIYSRVVDVTKNANDTGDAFSQTDYAVLSGVISSTDPYQGLAKTGNGMLLLTGVNTYKGATTIAEGTLSIMQDSNLGAAPTAAYALNTTPTLDGVVVTGNALTPGDVLIHGGAALGSYANMTLNANRTILLASGTTGGTAANINVYTGTKLTFGGQIADYINEKGTLGKVGLGSLYLSGNNVYTGGTDIKAGTLYANSAAGSSTGSGNVMVENGAVLRGTGYIAPATGNGVTVADGGNLAPGLTNGSPIANGHLNLTSSGTGAVLTLAAPAVHTGVAQLTFDLGSGSAPTGTAIDSLNLAGSSTYINLTINSVGEVVFNDNTISLNDLTAGNLALGNYLLFSSLSGNTGGLDTNFTGLTVAGDGEITAGLTISPTSGFTGNLYLQDGNIYLDLLTTPAVPEPGTWAMLLMGLGMLLVPVYRARRKQVTAL